MVTDLQYLRNLQSKSEVEEANKKEIYVPRTVLQNALEMAVINSPKRAGTGD